MMLLPSMTRPSRDTRIVRAKARREVHEFRRGARVQPQAIANRHVAARHSMRLRERLTEASSLQQIRRHPDRVAAVLAQRPRDLGQVLLLAQVGGLDQHRQVDAGHDLDLVRLEKRDAEIRRRAAEHVGRDQHAFRPLHARDRRGDLVARVLHVFVPADRHRGERRQVADDGLGGVDQLDRQLPVRDDDHADHGWRLPWPY